MGKLLDILSDIFIWADRTSGGSFRQSRRERRELEERIKSSPNKWIAICGRRY